MLTKGGERVNADNRLKNVKSSSCCISSYLVQINGGVKLGFFKWMDFARGGVSTGRVWGKNLVVAYFLGENTKKLNHRA